MSNTIQRTLAFTLLLLSLPLAFIVWLAMKIEDGGPFLFRQKRVGKDGSIFTLYKVRTMVEGAEGLREKYLPINEVDGPTFKIKDDPRFTKVGKVMSKTGLDELPQLINIIKGEMAFVGPRPLPVYEAKKVPKKYQKRRNVLPGITSLWAVKGLHRLTFQEWMELDVEYVRKKSVFLDLKIAFQTIYLILMFLMYELFRIDSNER